MAEKEKNASMEGEGKAPKSALSEVIKKLEIPPEIGDQIKQLDPENKELCQMSLEDILKEVEDQILGITDRNKKINDTLTNEYNIKNLGNEKSIDDGLSAAGLTDIREGLSYEVEKHKVLSEKLDTVKSLDQTVVSEELTKAKSAEPLPTETKLAIAKASNTDLATIDEVINKGANPQVQNLVDTYYLTTPTVQALIEKRLPESELGKANIAFQELRGSAREFGVLSSFTPKSLPSQLSDKSEKTKEAVIATFNSINKDNPDTRITRTGDTLRFTDPQDERYSYEIDMSEQPPRLAKSLNGLSISRELVPLTQEQKEKHNLETKKVQLIKTVAKDSQAVKLTNIAEVIPDTIQSSDAVKSYESAQVRYKEARNPTEKLSALEDLKSQNHLLESARRDSLTTENMGDEKYGKLEEALFSELEGLSRLETSLSQYLEIDKGLGRYNGVETQGNMENFDAFASENLGYLVDRHFDRLGPDANTALYRIIREINRNRDDKNKIAIDKRAMNEIEKKTLRDALIQIGGTPDVLTNGEKLPALQKRITESLRYTRDNPRSIERILSEGVSEMVS